MYEHEIITIWFLLWLSFSLLFKPLRRQLNTFLDSVWSWLLTFAVSHMAAFIAVWAVFFMWAINELGRG